MSIEAVDLFCGAGGLTCGLRQAGVSVRLGVDFDQACEFPYAKNNRAACIIRDIKEIQSDELAGYFSGTEEYRLVAGCAPCQTFSTYNQKANTDDSRWWLLREFIRVVEDVNPDFVTMENVPGLAEHDIFDEFLAFLGERGYHVDHKVLKCMEYGIPQKRERLVLIASRLGPIEILPPSKFRLKCETVADAIRELPPIGIGETHPDDPMHQCSQLSDLNMERMRASSPGGTWRDWPKHLVAKCHHKATGKTYPSVYGRMKWDDPAPTITTQFFGFGNGRFGHPEQNRAISLREGAIIQSFPHNYKFVAPNTPISKTIIGRLIGNAVPVRLGYVIGCSFRAHLRSIDKTKESPKK